MTDLERVARAVAKARWPYTPWDDLSPMEREQCRAIAAAAMRETRLIDAEALRERAEHSWLEGTVRNAECCDTAANWLTARAKGNGDGVIWWDSWAAAELRRQMDAQADDDTPSSIQRDKGLVWLEGWFDLTSIIPLVQAAERERCVRAAKETLRGCQRACLSPPSARETGNDPG